MTYVLFMYAIKIHFPGIFRLTSFQDKKEPSLAATNDKPGFSSLPVLNIGEFGILVP